MWNRDEATAASAQIRRAWRIVTWAGLLGSIYFALCVNGAPRVKFLTELKATAFDFGLISGLGALALAFQIVGGAMGNHFRCRKPIWMLLAASHRILFIGVILSPVMFLNDRARILWIVAVLFLHDALAQTSAPLWLSWMADLVPRDSLTRHWATRQRFITRANIVVMVVIAFGFHYFENSGRVIMGFTILASIGIALGIVDIMLFFAVPEPPMEKSSGEPWAKVMLQPLKDRKFRPYLIFVAYWQLAVFVAAPFFSLYMIDFLHLKVLTVQLFGAVSAIGIAVSSRFWGLLCDTYGYRPILQILSLFKGLTPLAFLICPQVPGLTIPFLVVAMFFDGIMNAGMMLSFQGVLLKSTPKQNRAMYIAASSFLSMGVAASLAPILSGYLIDTLNRSFMLDMGPYHFTGYHVVFALSFALRSGGTRLAAKIHDTQQVPLRTVLAQFKSPASLWVTRLVYRLQESPDEGQRLQAAITLGDLRNPMAIPELVRALKDPSVPVREAAADALGKIGVAEATGPLAAALFDSHSGIQSPAARALGKIGGVDSLKALTANLKIQNTEVLKSTIESLAETEDEEAILPLICLFHEVQDPDLRKRIAAALGKLGDTESVEEVLELLHGRRPSIREDISPSR